MNTNYDYGLPSDEEYWRKPVFGDSGEDALGLYDYSNYKINEDRNYDFDLGSFLKNVGNRGLDAAKGLGTSALNYLLNPSGSGILGLLAMLAAVKDRTPAYGGGTTMGMPAKTAILPTKTQGKYGPIAKYAAQGGLMQAYAQGGSVRPFPMQDGGFVMTKRAVDGAGGPQGLAQLLPNARMIRGPGTGTSDSIPATIQGRNGVTPAKVSNGESYVPPEGVEQAGGAQALYNLMNNLQRRA